MGVLLGLFKVASLYSAFLCVWLYCISAHSLKNIGNQFTCLLLKGNIGSGFGPLINFLTQP